MTLTKVQQEWVAALRSGAYRQTEGRLRNSANDSYCCLGVLCDLAVKAGVIKKFTGSGAHLPPEVVDWAGLKSDDGSYNDRTLRYRSLAEDNDSGDEFPDIAATIEERAESLFEPAEASHA